MRHKTAEIYWHYPKSIYSITKDPQYDGYLGVYAIYRKFGVNETLLYIGKADKCSVRSRLKEHLKYWLSSYRGDKIVRIGEILKPYPLLSEHIEDIESGLIYETQPIVNVSKRATYFCCNFHNILNTGYRGRLPRNISMYWQE